MTRFLEADFERRFTAGPTIQGALRRSVDEFSVTALIGSYANDQMQHYAIPRVTIDTGVLEGTQLLRGVSEIAFLGIPYAAPPVAELRWKPPRLPVKWQGPRAAKQSMAADFNPAEMRMRQANHHAANPAVPHEQV